MRESLSYATLVGLVAYSAIATDLYLPAIPAMVAELDASDPDGQLTLSIFMVGIGLGQLLFGPLSDYYGRLPVVTAGTLLFIAASLVCAAAINIDMLWLARLVQGIAASSGPVIARAMVRDRYHGNDAARVMSTLGAAMAVVPLVAPTLGSLLLVWIDWRATFVALGVFAVAVLLGLRGFSESAPAIGEGDIRILAVVRRFGTFLSDPRFLGYLLCGAASFAGIFAYLSTVSFFLYDVFAVKPANFGYAFAISVLGFMVGSLVSSALVHRLGPDRTMMLGCLLSLGGAMALVLLAQSPVLQTAALAGACWLVFFGIGLTFANASMGAVSLYPREAGAASAAYGFVHANLAAVVGLIAGDTYDGSLVPTALVMLGCALGAVVGLLMTLRFRVREEA